MTTWEALSLQNEGNDARKETCVASKVIKQDITNEDVAGQGCRRQAPDYSQWQ